MQMNNPFPENSLTKEYDLVKEVITSLTLDQIKMSLTKVKQTKK